MKKAGEVRGLVFTLLTGIIVSFKLNRGEWEVAHRVIARRRSNSFAF